MAVSGVGASYPGISVPPTLPNRFLAAGIPASLPALQPLAADAFSRASNTALLSAPAFLATSLPGAIPQNSTGQALTPPPQVMLPYGATPSPQIMYVPVVQSLPPEGTPQKQPNSSQQVPEASPKASNDELAPPPEKLPGEGATAQEVGYKVGKAVEALLQNNPELLDRADQLELDNPDSLVRQVHGALRPLTQWVPDMILNKAVAQVPLEYQDIAQRLINWLNTPESQLKSITEPQGQTSGPRPMSTVDHSQKSSESPSTKQVSSKEPDSHAGHDTLPLDELFPSDEKPSLKDRLNPFSFLPGKKDESSLDEILI